MPEQIGLLKLWTIVTDLNFGTKQISLISDNSYNSHTDNNTHDGTKGATSRKKRQGVLVWCLRLLLEKGSVKFGIL